MRFSLSSILIAIAMIAAACAGLTYQTNFWVSTTMSISLALYATMATRAIATRAEARAFAGAFTVVGSCYLLLAMTTAFRFQEFLVTNYPLAWAARGLDVTRNTGGGGMGSGGGFFSVPSDLTSSIMSVQQFGGELGSGRSLRNVNSLDEIIEATLATAPYSIALQRFFVIGHCVWSWLFGLIAGWAAAALFRREKRRESGIQSHQ